MSPPVSVSERVGGVLGSAVLGSATGARGGPTTGDMPGRGQCASVTLGRAAGAGQCRSVPESCPDLRGVLAC